MGPDPAAFRSPKAWWAAIWTLPLGGTLLQIEVDLGVRSVVGVGVGEVGGFDGDFGEQHRTGK